MLRNPLARHIALFLLVKAVLIGLGLWWFLGGFPGGMPEPRGVVAPPAAARS
ncbi:hypothetical protein [Azospirillum thiophilum]|uniref:hypothetical protein n=1 Tax=Azospirillum thiophilum TaxID=528244 RepID=UPI000A63A093|nr:hypothetical protein [Azospirillum thiophilum]